MRVLIVHNRYRPTAPSGENEVVDQEHRALADLGHEVARFERHSGDIEGWPALRRVTLPARVLWSEEARRSLSAELTRFAPDVVHVHNLFPLLTPAVLHACRRASVPVVATIHNYKLGCASGEFFRAGTVCHDCLRGSPAPALVHACYRGSRAVTLPVVAGQVLHLRTWRTAVGAYVFISDAQRRILAPLGLPAERSFVRHNFVPAPPADAGGMPAKEHQVAYVGRLDAAKGADVLRQAWAAFRLRRPASPLRLVIAGGGPLAEDVARWARQDPSVSMLGHVPRSEVGRILAASRAAVMPSQWEETFGLVAVEAMAAGTPAVASAHGAFPELITPGSDGALVAPADPAALVEVLMDVDDRPQQWDAYGEQARRTYERRFRPEASMDRLLEIYRFAMDNPIRPSLRDSGIAGGSRRSISREALGADHDGGPTSGRRGQRGS